MDEYTVVITPQASKELQNLIIWLSQFQEVDLPKWLEGLRSEIHKLKTMPRRFTRAPKYDRPGQHMRMLVYRERYLVIYTIVEKHRDVLITHINHGAQSQPAQ